MIEHFAHQPLRLGRGFGVGVAAVGQCQQRCAAHDGQPRARDRPARGGRRDRRRNGIAPPDRSGRRCRPRARAAARSPARPAAGARSAAARGACSPPAARSAKRRLVAREEARVRILARQELQQQLVQIEAAYERRTADSRQPAAPFGAQQRLQFVLPRPRQQQRLESLQQPSQFRARASRAARDHRDAAVFGRDRLDDRRSSRGTRRCAARTPAGRRGAAVERGGASPCRARPLQRTAAHSASLGGQRT